VPAFGQAEGEQQAAAAAGGAGGDGDQVAADGGRAGLRVAAAGDGAGGADQVAGDGGDGEPGGVGGELPRRQVREGAVVEVGQQLLDDGVAAVLLFGLDQLVRAVGEEGRERRPCGAACAAASPCPCRTRRTPARRRRSSCRS